MQAPKYGKFLSDTSECSPPHYYLKIFSLIFKVLSYSILIQFPEMSSPYKPWFIRKLWQVSFKSIKQLLQPLAFFLPLNLYIPKLLEKADLLPTSAAAMQSIYYWSHAQLFGCFVIFISRFITCPLLLLLPHTQRQLHTSLGAEGNLLLLICIFKVHKMLDRRWYFLKMAPTISVIQYLFTLQNWRRKWQPTPAFLPGEFLGQRNLGGYYSPVHGVAKSWIQLSNKHTHIYITVHIWHHFLQEVESASSLLESGLDFLTEFLSRIWPKYHYLLKLGHKELYHIHLTGWNTLEACSHNVST